MNETFFNELEFYFIGDGPLFEETVKPLKKMKNVSSENRKARFVCCIKIADIEMNFQYEFTGYSEGLIMDNIYGSNGFGYDPIFKPLGYNVSMGSLKPAVKDKISHRGLASKKLIKEILNGR